MTTRQNSLEEKKTLLFENRKEYGSVSQVDKTQVQNGLANGAAGQGMTNGDHCHQSDPEQLMDKKARRKLLLASLLCLVFMIAEIVGGVLANSLAIATDAAHLLTDFASFMISLFAIYLASRPATKTMSFGWHRAEVMGALVSVLMIWVVTGILVYMAIERVITGDYEIDATVMLITAGIGVGFNLVMGCTLHDHGHSHGGGGHGHSHGGHRHSHSQPDTDTVIDVSNIESEEKPLVEEKKDAQNINVRAAFVHVIGDFVQSVGVFIAALIIFFKPDWKLADPICTFLFSVLVLITTITILKDTLNVLMEDGTVNNSEVMQEAGRVMKDKFGVHECTIQIEAFSEDMNDCTQCQDPKD